MIFDRLFEKIKSSSDLSINYKVLGNSYNLGSKDEDNFLDKCFGVQLTKYCTNKCSWCCSNCEENEQYIDINSLDKLLKNTTNFSVTGGEAMLHPNFKELVLKYKNLNSDKDDVKNYLGLTVMTSGINPDSPELLIKRYYDNLEVLFQESNLTKEGIKLRVNINFSFSDGIKPSERLTNFMKKIKEFEQKYNKAFLDIPLVYFDVVTIQDPNEKLIELKEKYKEYFKPFILDRYKVIKVLSSGRKKSEIISSVSNCHLDNSIQARSNGNISICCAVESEMNGGLEAYANIYTNSVDEIIERRTVYLGLLKEFQAQKGNSCSICVSKNGFNDFLKQKLEEL